MIAAFLLAAILDFGPERALVPNPAIGAAPSQRERAHVAASDHGSLVIWSDRRSGDWNVYGARLDRAGALLDERGLPISKGIAGDVVWTGNAYLVAYSLHPIVYVRIMTPDGVMGEPIATIDVGSWEAHTVRLATDGATVLLMTNSGRGAVLGLDGTKKRAFDFGVVLRAEWGLDIAVAHDGYGLATITAQGVAFRRIYADHDEPAQLLPESAKATTVGLGSDGTRFLASYDNNFLRAHRIGDTTVNTISPFAAAFPKVVWRGDHYLITFTRPTNIDAMAVRVAPDGDPVSGVVQFATATPPSAPDADRRPDGTGVAAWVTNNVVEAGFFDSADAAPTGVKPLAFSAPAQDLVRVDAQGGDVFTMWREAVGGDETVRLTRGAGGPVITLASGDAWPHEVIVDGNVVWALWARYDVGIVVQRFTRGLTPIDAAPVRALQVEHSSYIEYRRTQIAAGGGALLLASDLGENETGISYSIVREVNGVLTADLAFLPTPFMARMPAVAWNGSEFLVIWAYAQGPWEWWMFRVDDHLVMRRVGADGVLRDDADVTISDDPGRFIGDIRAVRSGNGVAVFWQTTPVRSTTLIRDTFAMRVGDAEHSPIENPGQRRLREVTTLGDSFLMLWTRDDAELVVLDEHFDALEYEQFVVTGPDIASTAARPVLAYARVDEDQGGVPRAFLRTASAKSRSVRR